MKTIILSLILIACLLLSAVNAGKWLVYSEPPQKSDVIILVVDKLAINQRAIDLYKNGYAPYLLLTRADPQSEAEAISEGVPAQAIIPEVRADSTYENALYSKELMEQHGFRKAIVVTSDYHSLRTRLTFLRVFKNTGAAFVFLSAPDPLFDAARWWTSGRNIRHILREYCGIAALYLGMGPYVTDTEINRSPLLSFLFNP